MNSLARLRTAIEPALWVERMDERTPTARVWQHALDARRRYCVVRQSTHCFASPDSPWLDQVIDYRLRWTPNGWVPVASPFAVCIARKGEHVAIGGADFELLDFGMLRGTSWQALLRIQSEQLKLTPRSAPYRVAPTWHASYIDGQIAPGVDFHAAVSAKGYGKELRFARAVQTHWFSKLSDAEFFGFRYRMIGELAPDWVMRTPRMYVHRRGGQARGFYRREGEYLYVLFPRYQLDRLLPGQWIIDPAITQESITANDDDCYDDADANLNYTSGYNGRDYAGGYGGGSTSVAAGYRFQTIPIPADATGMNSASLQLFREAMVGTPDLAITADDVDDAGAWTNGAGTNRPQGSGYTPTTAVVTWTANFGANGAYVATPDIATVVDEVIQRAGWASGNDIRFRVGRNTGTGNNHLACNDFNNNSTTEEGLFDADYIAAAAGGQNPYQPWAQRGPVQAQ